MMKRIKESEPRSYAMIHDTIYDLEPSYAELYQKIRGKKPWLIGPLFHFSKREEANTAVQEQHSCLSWLDSQEPNSVVYNCFGSMGRFSDAQLTEIDLALETSDSSFLWVLEYQRSHGHCSQSSSTMRSWWRFLDVGVSVGAEVWHISFDVKDTIVKKEKIEASLKILMNTSRESEEIRSRAKDVKAMIDRAVEKGGSSYNHLTALVEEPKCHVFGNLEE
ncbi:hypothetical protein BC332_31005 [Capsicum chinense]|nr:hypothetical protein BC332_31005 [Capsicum chinense]